MSIKIFINLGAGNLNEGFDRTNSRIEVEGRLVAQQQGSLPGNATLQELHYRWQFDYAAYYDNYFQAIRGNAAEIELDNTGVTGFSVTSFEQTRIELERQMRSWLDNSSLSQIGTYLRSRVSSHAEMIIIVESADDRIFRLPWHCWSVLCDYSQAEITFSLNNYQCQTPNISPRTKPKILAVFGDRTGIDTTADAASLRQLEADLVMLTEPSISELTHQLTDRQGWDLLFFAGHGSDNPVGSIRLNLTESATLADLKPALKTAIANGLNLAIFNCCSGLGLAASLAELNIPTAIVMREAIPNRVAQDFLQTFLHSFKSGKSLLAAVAAARQRLQAIESDFPCATWLPVVFWNPTVELPTWKSFYPQPLARIKLWQLGAIAIATTTAIWGVRSQGYLEPVELAAYDLVMATRPISEVADNRILIIGIDRDKPVTDRVLAIALTKLQQYHPQAIGLDIYRDRAVGEGHRDLTTLLQQDPIVSACLMSGDSPNFPGVHAPDGVQPERVGFTNFSLDRDFRLRRQLLGMAPVDRGCTTDRALSLSLALKYLNVTADEAADGNIQIGSHQLTVLNGNFGGYRSTPSHDNLRGFQVMLNYRNAPQVAPQVSLNDILNGIVSSDAIAGKIVLIGYVGRDGTDTFEIGTRRTLPGVKIHAQMTSNLLAHILDDRALITTWGDLAEFGWILLWANVGGLIWLHSGGMKLWLIETGAIAIIVITCGVYLDTRSIWIPCIPPIMAVVLTPLFATGAERWQFRNQASRSHVSI
ncbi:CHASE2 domain-containing protein [Chamaesiphon sp. GL140_3_metabinner_50]|uniref:CHASE2 domain-containing protein n=1 Tax=Chamaesiphon sp. GL140_3_metabinner_50 TaxID=2970812 RepID=UPI0025F5575A|nr:CHASE2 domain-containing protein [Chamaesiphon sp. GL140_3_metabinner_50]